MDKIQILTYKSITVIIALSLTLIISSLTLLLITVEFIGFREIQNRSNHFSYKAHFNTNMLFGLKTYRTNTFPFGKTSVSTLNSSSNSSQNMLAKIVSLGSTATACSFIKTCSVRCTGGTLQEAIGATNSLIENDNTCTVQYITLELKSTIFPDNSISSGWLKDLIASVKAIKIISSDLEELGDSSFSGKPFGSNGNPLSLTLTDSNIKYLKKSTFIGSYISALEISFSSMRQSIIIEEDALGDTSFTVQSISINYCIGSGEAIRNLTGIGAVLGGLKILDLSLNIIENLEKDSFVKAPKLEQLYLLSNGMSDIEVGAFAGLNNILQLYLNNNNLKILSPGVFDDLYSILSLYLDNNPWNCTCDMQWFKEYVMSLPQIEYRRCKVGSEWIDMEDVEFCQGNSSTTTKTTTTTSSTTKTATSSVTVPSTTPEDSSDFIYEKINCRNLLAYPLENITDADADFFLPSIFKRRNINSTIIEIGNSLTYRVDLTGVMKSTDFLVWTNVENRSDYGCIYNINGYILMNLHFQKTYTLCFSSNDTTDTYALIADDCIAISTPADWSHRAWLSNNQKIVVILSVILTFLVTIAVASYAVYYLVKYNPELIKGNKRVLIVKRGSYSPNILVMPNKKDNFRHASLCTNYEGYLTPKLKRWAKNKFCDLRSTISDNSKNDSSEDKMIRMDNDEKNIYEPPPPLPPNHPTKRRDSGRPYFYSNM